MELYIDLFCITMVLFMPVNIIFQYFPCDALVCSFLIINLIKISVYVCVKCIIFYESNIGR